MKPITLLLAAGSLLLSAQGLSAQTDGSGKKEYWNANTLGCHLLPQGISLPI